MTDAPAVPADAAALPSGRGMPLMGLGTWRLSGDDAVRATGEALAAGYRHLDTATMYANERQVGTALRKAGLPRDDVFVTSKLPPERSDRVRQTLEQSLEQLGLDALDLWLVHWPPERSTGVAVWEGFLAAQADGLVRDVGVSNYSDAEIDALTEATGTTPAVNQIRWSPLLFDPAVVRAHRERGVVLEGYSGLKGGTLEHPVVTGIAERTGRTPAQVILRWHVQHGTVVIPKSASAERIRSNADVGGFELSDHDMAALDRLGTGGR
jgi:diketogulonate reductase-like aldo/keto reductase